MADNVLTSPLLQSADLFVQPPTRVILAAGVWTQVLAPDPMRFAAMFAPVAVSGGFLISPHNTPPAVTSYGPASVLPTLLHSAVYPLLISGSWWGTSGADVEVFVYDVKRLQ